MIPIIKILYSLKILKWDHRKILRGTESVVKDSTDFQKEMKYKLIPLEKGLKMSI